MRKDILLTLLAASSAPLGMMANVSVDAVNDNWTNSGFNLAEGALAQLATETVTVPYASNGYIQGTIANVVKGKYVLTFVGDNAKVTVNDKVYTAGDEFEAEGKLTIKVESADGTSGFTFGKVGLELQWNQAAYYDACEALNYATSGENYLNYLTDFDIDQNDLDKNGNLKESAASKYSDIQKQAIEQRNLKIQYKAEYGKLVNSATTAADLLKWYQTYWLPDGLETTDGTMLNLIAQRIATSKALLKSYYPEKNQKYFDSKNNDWQKKLNDLTDTFDNDTVKAQVDITAAQQVVDAANQALKDIDKNLDPAQYKAALDAAIADGNTKVDAAIKALKNDYNNYSGIYTAYLKNVEAQNALDAAYIKAFSYIVALENETYLEAQKSNLNEISGGKQKKEVVLDWTITQMQYLREAAGLNSVELLIEEFLETVKANVAAYAVANEAIDTLRTNLEAAETDINAEDPGIRDAAKEALNDTVANIKAKIEALQETADTKYVENTLAPNGIDTTAIQGEIDELNAALEQAQSDLADLNDAHKAVTDKLDKWEKDLEAADTAIDEAGVKDQYDVRTKYSEVRGNIEAAIEAARTAAEAEYEECLADAEKTYSYKIDSSIEQFIGTAIENYKTDGVALASAIKEVVEAIEALDAAGPKNVDDLTKYLIEGATAPAVPDFADVPTSTEAQTALDTAWASERVGDILPAVKKISVPAVDGEDGANAKISSIREAYLDAVMDADLAYAKAQVNDAADWYLDNINAYDEEEGYSDGWETGDKYKQPVNDKKTPLETLKAKYADDQSEQPAALAAAKVDNDREKAFSELKTALEKDIAEAATDKTAAENAWASLGLMYGMDTVKDADNNVQPTTKENFVQKSYDNVGQAKTDILTFITKNIPDSETNKAAEYYTKLANEYYNGKAATETEDAVKGAAELLADAIEKYKEAALNETYPNGKVFRGDWGAYYMEQLDNLSGDLNFIKALVEANESNHNAQLTKSAAVKEAVEDAQAWGANLDDEYVTEKAALDGLTAAVEAIDAEVLAAYGIGESEAKNQDLIAAYDNILTQISDLKAGLYTDYQNAVNFLNDQAVAGIWNKLYTELNQTWKDARDKWNAYSDVKNADYYNAIKDILGTHSVIWQYNEKIVKLNSDVDKMVAARVAKVNPEEAPADWTPEKLKNLILDKEDFQEYTDTANTYINEINDLLTSMIRSVNAKATEYYTEKYQGVKALLDGANNVEAQLEEMTFGENKVTYTKDPALAALNLKLTGAEALYNGANKFELDEVLIANEYTLVMDDVLKQLKQIDEAFDFDGEAVAKAYWDEVANAAAAYYNDIESQIKTLCDENGVEDTYTAGLEENVIGALASYREQLADPEVKFATNISDLLAGVNDLTKAAEGYLNQAKDAVKAAQADKEAQKAAQDALTTAIGDLEDMFNAMVEAVGTLDLTEDELVALNMAGIRTNIDRIQSDFAATKNYVEAQNGLNLQIDGVKAAINTVYAQAYNCEYSFVGAVLNELKRAQNNLKGTETVNEKEYEALTTAIQGFEDTYTGLANPEVPAEKYEDILALYDSMKNFVDKEENEQLKAEVNPDILNPSDRTIDNTEILADLNDHLDNVKADITTAQQALEAWNNNTEYRQEVVTEYSEKLAALQTKADELATALEAAGDSVAALQEYYNGEIEGLGNELDALQTAIEAAQAQADAYQASDNNYETLKGYINQVNAFIDEISTNVAAYQKLSDESKAQYLGWLADFKTYTMAGAQSELDNLKASHQVTNEYVDEMSYALVDETNPDGCMMDQLKSLGNYIALQNTGLYIDAASAAINAAELMVVDGRHANQAELNEALQTLKDTLLGLQSDYAEVNDAVTATEYATMVSTTEELNNAAQELIANAEALEVEAEDSKVVMGDLNGTGTVTMADVSVLLDLILEGDDYDETNAKHIAADVNADNRITVADYQTLLNMLLNEGTANSARAIAAFSPAKNVQAALSAVVISEEGSVRRIAVMLDGGNAFTQAQFDLQLAAGQTLLDETAADRAELHSLMSATTLKGDHRVLLISDDKASFTGMQGALAIFEVEGKGDIKLANVSFSDADGVAYYMPESSIGTNGINGMIDGLKNFGRRIYNAGGVMLNKLQKGINIIRNADGTTEKKVGK